MVNILWKVLEKNVTMFLYHTTYFHLICVFLF